MRMISRREALELIADHGWKPNDCTVAYHQGCNYHCATFDHALGIHDQYAVIDVKNWLGY